MNSILLTFAILLIAFAVFAMAAPHEEGILADGADEDNYNPEDPQSFLKLKKFKKLFLG
ncbi:unnamed protein product [Diamesa serratosioi]